MLPLSLLDVKFDWSKLLAASGRVRRCEVILGGMVLTMTSSPRSLVHVEGGLGTKDPIQDVTRVRV